jgi:hypothetical protein
MPSQLFRPEARTAIVGLGSIWLLSRFRVLAIVSSASKTALGGITHGQGRHAHSVLKEPRGSGGFVARNVDGRI